LLDGLGPQELLCSIFNSDLFTLFMKRLVAILSSKHDARIIETAMRTLNFLVIPDNSPHDIFVKENVLSVLVILILHSIDSVIVMISSTLARLCSPSVRHNTLNDEEFSTFNQKYIVDLGGIEIVLGLLFSTYPKTQESALELISSLSENNPGLSAKILSFQSAIDQITYLVKDKRPRVRLLSSKCIAYLNKYNEISSGKRELLENITSVLIKLLDEKYSLQIHEEVPFILANLIAGNEDLQKICSNADCIRTFCSFVSSASSSLRLKQTSLMALTELCQLLEDAKKKTIESGILSTTISLLESDDYALRLSSIRFIRNLSRSSKSLRSSITELEIVRPLLKLLNDARNDIQVNALAALCNCVLDSFAVKKIILENGGIQQLINKTQSMDITLKLNSVCTLRNLLYMADIKLKQEVILLLTVDGICLLISDSCSLAVQANSLGLLRNLIHKDLSCLFSTDIVKRLIELLEKVLRPYGTSSPEVIEQALYCICNISTGGEEYKKCIVNSNLIECALSYMENQTLSIRIAVLWCVIFWTEPDCIDIKQIISKLNQLDCQKKLQVMLDDHHLEIKDQAHLALDYIRKSEVSLN